MQQPIMAQQVVVLGVPFSDAHIARKVRRVMGLAVLASLTTLHPCQI